MAERTNGVEGCYVVDRAETREETEQRVSDALEKALAFEGLTKGREKIFTDEISNQQAIGKLKAIYESVQ